MSKTVLILTLLAILVLAAEPLNNKTVLAQADLGLTVGTTDAVESCLDPAHAYDYFGWNVIQSLGCGLVEYKVNATGSPDDFVPSLATSWSVSSDGLEWTFNLRQVVKYDDGTEFNATHVKYTFDRGMDIADPDGAFLGIGYCDIIQNVTVVDKDIVKFYLKIPFAAFLSLVALPVSFIVDPKYAPMHGTSWNTTDVVVYNDGNARASHPMGLGPYLLKNWTRVAGRDYEMRLEANPNYWNASGGYPKTDNIILKFYSNSTGLALAIQAGEIDIAYRQLGATDIDIMKTNPDLKVWEGDGPFIQYLCLQEKYAPFNETEIRQAIGAAINRTAIVQTIFSRQAQELYSIIPTGVFGHSDVFQKLGDPNYTRTRELLAKFGYNETNKLTFTLWYEISGHYPQSQQQAQGLKTSMETSGVITVSLQGIDWPAYRGMRQNEVMQAYILGWYPDYVDPDDYVFPLIHSSGGSWIHDNYNNPTMDQLIELARGNATSTERSALYDQIQNLTTTDCPIIPLFQGLTYAVSKREITGIYLDITAPLRYWYIASSHNDIAITDITSLKTVVGQGYNTSVDVTVADVGDFNETCNVTVYSALTYTSNTTAIHTFTNVTLDSGTSTVLTFTWGTAGFAYGNYTLWAYAEPVPSETNVANNNYTCSVPVHIGVPGDINNDGTVDMKDVMNAVYAFNSFPGKSRWSPNADIDGNGRVDLRDILTIVINFNKHE